MARIVCLAALAVPWAVVPSTLHAQDVELKFPYYNSFEEPDEIGRWELLAGAEAQKCTDKWYIGNVDGLGVIDGKNALYISGDGGTNPVFGNRKNVVAAYRRIALPSTITKRKRLELTFDWKNQAPAKSGTFIQVALVPEDFPFDVESKDNSTAEPAWKSAYGVRQIETPDGRTAKLQGKEFWTTAQATFNMDPGKVYKLVFVWTNDGKSNSKEEKATPYLSACIDNVQISSADCPMPKNIAVDYGCDSTVLTWSGSVYNYELQYRNKAGGGWETIKDVVENRYVFRYLPEGIYDFRLRSIGLDGEMSVYNTLYSQLVFCPTNHCINYVDLKSKNIQCFKGEANEGSASLMECEPENHGSNSIMSRHTVHWDPNEYDPRTLDPTTGKRLKTVPSGEFASIRLGNWNDGGEAEAIEIKYEVNFTSAKVLLLSYALVFEEPTGHSKEQQPYFKLVLMRDDGSEIDPICGKAEFYADPDDPQWIRYTKDKVTVAWKDWTMIGFDLTNIGVADGETITIHLENRDCSPKDHYSYSYFVMGCASGTIENVSCGAAPVVDLEAPSGFDYRWYTADEPDGDINGNNQVLQVKTGDNTVYGCEVMFKQNPECSFHLRSEVSTREPHADMECRQVPENCENWVRFVNTSHVDNIDVDGDTVCSDRKTETAYWKFDGGATEYGDTIYKLFPPEGGTVKVKLKAGLSNDNCLDSVERTFEIKSILTPRPVGPRDTAVCWGGSLTLPDGATIGVDSVHTAIMKNWAGCDSVEIFNITVRDRILPTDTVDTICFGESFVHDGKEYTTSGTYPLTYITDDGCDSVVNVKLHVRDKVTFAYSTKPEAGAANTGEIVITDAPEDYTYSVNGVEGAPLTGLKGGVYKVVVYNKWGCAGDTAEIVVDRECLELELAGGTDGPLYACAGDKSLSIGVTVHRGILSAYEVNYGQKALDAGFVNYKGDVEQNAVTIALPDSCKVDYYSAEIVFDDVICEDTVIPVVFAVYYAADIVQQKWNDVLAVKNSLYNGDYSFSKFVWYKDGQTVGGETGPYLYIDNAELDTASEYQVLLTRSDDGVEIPTCPIKPHTPKAEVSPYPAVTTLAANARLKIEAVQRQVAVCLFNAAGQICFSGMLDEGSTGVPMPPVPGVYLLVVADGSDTHRYKLIVR